MKRQTPSILLISSNSSGRGGGERYLVFMAMGLIDLGWEVHALLSSVEYMDDWATELQDRGGLVHRLDLKALRDRPLRFLQSLLDIKQHKLIAGICQSIRPDAILVNQQYDEDGLDYLLGAFKARSCPVAGVIHMPMTENKNERPFGRIRGKILRHWYQCHPYIKIFSSSGSEKEFLDYYKIESTTAVVHSGIPLDNSTPDITAYRQLDDHWINAVSCESEPRMPVIGFVGQFVSQKNLQLLIDSWLWAAEFGVQTRLLLIGDGPERPILEKQLAKAADSRFWRITGWGKNYSAYMANLDIFVMPSRFEGLPLALIEAVGMGIPTIVSNFNGAQEIAEHASWVDILQENSTEELGRAIVEKVNKLSCQRDAARNGIVHFRDYFSPSRMAKDFLCALNLRNL